jgi:hypothetical protein
LLVFIYWYLGLVFCYALRFSHRERGTLLQQPKRVPRKGRRYSYAPEKQGCPFIQHRYHAAPELAKNAQTCWHRNPMIMLLPKWLAEAEGKSKK